MLRYYHLDPATCEALWNLRRCISFTAAFIFCVHELRWWYYWSRSYRPMSVVNPVIHFPMLDFSSNHYRDYNKTLSRSKIERKVGRSTCNFNDMYIHACINVVLILFIAVASSVGITRSVQLFCVFSNPFSFKKSTNPIKITNDLV